MSLSTNLSVAQRVRRLRGTEPQNEAARRIGVSPSTLCCIEQGVRHGTNHRTLLQIASAYGVAVEYLEGDIPDYVRAWAERSTANQAPSPGMRLADLLRELELRYDITPVHVADAMEISVGDLLLCTEDRAAPRPVVEMLESLIRVPADSLLFGLDLPPDVVSRYAPAIWAAIRSGLPPEDLLGLVGQVQSSSK